MNKKFLKITIGMFLCTLCLFFVSLGFLYNNDIKELYQSPFGNDNPIKMSYVDMKDVEGHKEIVVTAKNITKYPVLMMKCDLSIPTKYNVEVKIPYSFGFEEYDISSGFDAGEEKTLYFQVPNELFNEIPKDFNRLRLETNLNVYRFRSNNTYWIQRGSGNFPNEIRIPQLINRF